MKRERNALHEGQAERRLYFMKRKIKEIISAVLYGIAEAKRYYTVKPHQINKDVRYMHDVKSWGREAAAVVEARQAKQTVRYGGNVIQINKGKTIADVFWKGEQNVTV